ncbi:MAG: glycosyltransferase [Calothrix sp. FI2-JRJ7]|jgi:glycosyltransferase involved in cell wall biosynthesis|nr:glycosyltransferase [Calothrix sp. FI2-JRJ7]
MGLCGSLNKAIIERRDSEFVARLDQDDISFPSRLEEQMNFMLQNPSYACVLSNISRIGIDGKEFGYYQKTSNNASSDEIDDYDSKRYGCIVHSTILFRRKKFIEAGGYRQELYPVDDYDLLLRFSSLFSVAVIKKPLVKYRIHGKAGTFNSFWKMQTNTRYVEEMDERRKNGESEIPLAQWLELDKPLGVQQFQRYLDGTGQLFFRQAGSLIGEGKKLQGGLYLVGAFRCNSRFTTKRLLALRTSKVKHSTHGA